MLFDVGRASGTKLCRLLWNTNLVEIELSKDNTECLCRDNLFFRAPEAVNNC